MVELETLQLKGSCHMCGKCCEAIHIRLSPEDIKKMAEDARRRGFDDTNNDPIFVDQHWKPITREEAFRINPYLQEQHNELVSEYGEALLSDSYKRLQYYTCNQHDKETGKCTIHDLRPSVCAGYPWYDRIPQSDHLFYSAECGYRADVKGGDSDDRA